MKREKEEDDGSSSEPALKRPRLEEEEDEEEEGGEKRRSPTTSTTSSSSGGGVDDDDDDDNVSILVSKPRKKTVGSSNRFVSKWTACPIPESELEAVDEFVSDAIALQSGVASVLGKKKENDDDGREEAKELLRQEEEQQQPSTPGTSTTCTTSSSSSFPTYKALIETIRKKQDPSLLLKVLIVLRTSKNGTLTNMTSQPTTHASLLHHLFKIHPFQLPKEKALQNDYQVYYKFYICDAYLQLLIAIVSANSVFCKPALVTLWKRLSSLHRERELSLENTNDDDHNDNDNNDQLAKTRKKQQQEEEFLMRQTIASQRLLNAICEIVRLVPTSLGELSIIVQTSVPPFACIRKEHMMWFLKQCWAILERTASISNNNTLFSVFSNIIETCLELDVSFKIIDEGEAMLMLMEEKADDTVKTLDKVLDMNENKNKTSNNNNNNNNNNNKTNPEQKIVLDEMADKLDEVMLSCFQYLEGRLSKLDSQEERQEEQETLLHLILPCFESKILTAYKCKFLQYLIFVLCGYGTTTTKTKTREGSLLEEKDHRQEGNHHHHHDHESCYRIFCEKLIEIAYDNNNKQTIMRPRMVRQTAVCYLASFCGRATYVSPQTVCESMVALLKWAEAYMEAMAISTARAQDQLPALREEQCHNNVVVVKQQKQKQQYALWETHSLFYTVCQGAFYIMCFRGREAMEYYNKAVKYWKERKPTDNEQDDAPPPPYLELDHVDISRPRWTAIVSHPTLTPLRFCLSSVRQEFLRAAKVFGLLDETLIEKLWTMDEEENDKTKTTTPKKMRNTTTKKNALASTPIIVPGSSFGSSSSPVIKDPQTTTTTAPSSSTTTTTTARRKRLQANRRSKSIGGGIGGLGKNASNPLDSFFPFDPYLLRKSYPHVEKYYRHWEGSIAPEEDDDDDDDERMMDEEDDDVAITNTSSPHGVDDELVKDQSTAHDVAKVDYLNGANGPLQKGEKKDEKGDGDDETVVTTVDEPPTAAVIGNLDAVDCSADNVAGEASQRRSRGFSICSGGSW